MKAFIAVGVCFLALASSGRSSAAELKVGDGAPDFALQASDGKTYKASDFKNKQAIECKSLAEHGDLIKQYDVTYFMISVDPLDKNMSFAQDEHADFPLLSDPTKKTADAYGVLGMLGMANRWTFYIGKDGTIRAIDKSVKPATSAEDMAARLHELGVSSRGQSR
jgi:thioredoxin-dependent peroxiredoxin